MIARSTDHSYRKVLNGLAAAGAALLISGCSQAVPTATSPGPVAPGSSIASTLPLSNGGTLHVGMYLTDYESFQTSDGGRNTVWDPQGTWASPAFELFRCCLLRTLMSYNGQSTTQGGTILRPDLASGPPQISSDGLTWTFQIKAGLRYAPPYADTPIVAEDFIRALERELKPNTFGDPHTPLGAYAFFYGDILGAEDYSAGRVRSISGLEAPDPHTLVIRLVRPAGDLATRLALAATAPIPPGAADGHDVSYGPYLVASGPYMIEGTTRNRPATGYMPGKSLTLVRNPSWTRSSDDLRRAYVDRIEITNLSGPEANDNGLAAVSAGSIDFVLDGELSPEQLTQLQARPTLAGQVHFVDVSASAWISMNPAMPPLDDLHVRRAINYIVDRAAMTQALDPTARTETHVIPDSMEAGLLLDYDPYATPDHAGSLEKAKAEMALSPYDPNHDGTCDAAVCQALPTLANGSIPGATAALELLSKSLAQIGVVLKASVEPDDRTYFARIQEPAAHVGIALPIQWQSDYLNGSNWFLPLVHSSSVLTAGNSLFGASAAELKTWGYPVSSVPTLDGKINDCVARTGFSQDECWAEADQFLMERVATWVPLLSRQAARIASSRISSFSFDQSSSDPALDQIALR